MAAIIGYVDPLTVSLGEDVSVYVSCVSKDYTSKLVRLGPGWNNPDAPPVSHRAVPEVVLRTCKGREQYTRPGSYIYFQKWLGSNYAAHECSGLTIDFWCCPSLPEGAGHAQYLFSTMDHSCKSSISCHVGPEGLLVVTVAGSDSTEECVANEKLRRHSWYHLTISTHQQGITLTNHK